METSETGAQNNHYHNMQTEKGGRKGQGGRKRERGKKLSRWLNS